MFPSLKLICLLTESPSLNVRLLTEMKAGDDEQTRTFRARRVHELLKAYDPDLVEVLSLGWEAFRVDLIECHGRACWVSKHSTGTEVKGWVKVVYIYIYIYGYMVLVDVWGAFPWGSFATCHGPTCADHLYINRSKYIYIYHER